MIASDIRLLADPRLGNRSYVAADVCVVVGIGLLEPMGRWRHRIEDVLSMGRLQLFNQRTSERASSKQRRRVWEGVGASATELELTSWYDTTMQWRKWQSVSQVAR